MPQSRRPHAKKKKLFPWLSVTLIVFGLGFFFSVGGFVFAASQEAHDSFCASCHTQPESAYYGRSTAGQAVDLASYHQSQKMNQPQKVNCIDCHSGQGITGRVAAELLGAGNAVKWYTGTAVQPAVLKVPIGDGNCLKCHQDVTRRGFTPKEQFSQSIQMGGEGEEVGHVNHWHEYLARWQAASSTAGGCVSCHSGHTTNGQAQIGFMAIDAVQTTCESCHQVLRGEG